MDDQALVCGQCGAVVGMSYGAPGSRSKPHSEPFTTKPMLPHAMGGGGQTVRLTNRVKGILKSPRREWPVIASEATSAGHIYVGYAVPLAAIGALAMFVSHVVVGTRLPMLGLVRENVVDGLAGAILVFTLALAHLFFLSLIVEALARKFGGQCDRVQALKLAAYSYTPIWLAGIAYVIPALSVLWLVAAAYALYLAFVGLPILTRCAPPQAAKVTLLAGGAAFLLFTVLGALIAALIGFGPALFG